jgi:perosamine synthetase
MAIPLYRPFYKRKEMDAVLTTMVEHSPGPGQQHERLVESFLEECNAQGGLSTRSRIQAYEAILDALLELDCNALGMTVLMPRYLMELAAKRKFHVQLFDVDPSSGAPLWNDLLQDSEKSLDAFIFQDHFGLYQAQELEDASFLVIEDISEGLFGQVEEEIIGSKADFLVLGFEENHSLPSGMGSLVLAKTPQQAKALEKACTLWDNEYFMADLNSSLALHQIKEYRKNQVRRREIVESFDRSIQKGKHSVLGQGAREQLNLSSYPVVLNSPVKEVAKYATKKGIETKLAFNHTILQEYTEEDTDKTIQLNWNHYPNARDLVLRTLLFPCYPAMRKQELEIIQKVLSTLP